MSTGDVRVFVLEGFFFEHDGSGFLEISDKDKTRHGRGRDLLRYLAFLGRGKSSDLETVASLLLGSPHDRRSRPVNALSDPISAWTKVFGGQSLKQREGNRQVLRIPPGTWVDYWVFRERLAAAPEARYARDAVAALQEAIHTYEQSSNLSWRQREGRTGTGGNRQKDTRHPDPLEVHVVDYRDRLVTAYIDYATLLALMGDLRQAYRLLQRWTHPVEGRTDDHQPPGVFNKPLWQARLAIASKVGQTAAVFEAYGQLPRRFPGGLAPPEEDDLEIFCRGYWEKLLERASKYACWRTLTVEPRYASSVARIIPEMTRVENAMSQLNDERDQSSERFAFWVLGDPSSRSMMEKLLRVLTDPARSLPTRLQATWCITQMTEALRFDVAQELDQSSASDRICRLLANALQHERRMEDVVGELTEDPAQKRKLLTEVRRLEDYRDAFRRDVNRRDQEQGSAVGFL